VDKTPIIIVRDKNDRDFKSKIIDENLFMVEYLEGPIDFEVFATEVKKCFISTKASHVLIINDHKIITRKFMRYVTFASSNIKYVDFYQIAGGQITLSLIRNLIHNIRTVVVIKILLRIPIAILKILQKIFYNLPVSSNLKDLVVSSIKRNYENINRFDSDNLYLSNVVNWNNIRPPLKAFFVSKAWLMALAHLQSEPLLAFERLNVALARSGNFYVASKFRLF
jgi:hypothetical protein